MTKNIPLPKFQKHDLLSIVIKDMVSGEGFVTIKGTVHQSDVSYVMLNQSLSATDKSFVSFKQDDIQEIRQEICPCEGVMVRPKYPSLGDSLVVCDYNFQLHRVLVTSLPIKLPIENSMVKSIEILVYPPKKYDWEKGSMEKYTFRVIPGKFMEAFIHTQVDPFRAPFVSVEPTSDDASNALDKLPPPNTEAQRIIRTRRLVKQ